eukprot:TRINITY_DN2675_c0_g1_i1.p1 TRINITY_DN2675_c0_g1~~TRINITY_DN2675_c0_g1_i1.p1  ORF type:complete len:134 (-),score=17.79 TRINITY_DN2675_c0_g1_i1:71-415(-)
MIIDKQEPESILIIQGVLALHGEQNAETTYEWCYNGTVVLAQAEGYSNNSGYSRPVPTAAVIAGHKTTGKQQLSLKWRMANAASGRPCSFINPDGHQHVQLRQSTSTIVVMEVL